VDETTYQCNQVPPKDYDKVTSFLARAPRYPTLLMKLAALDLENFDGWWHAAFGKGGEIKALAGVEGTTANIYGEDDSATRTLAQAMARAAGSRASTGGTHMLFGEVGLMGVFWAGFQKINRKVVGDKERTLTSLKAAPETNSAYSVEIATAKDLKLVSEFAAEQSLEQWDADPRRASREAHEKRCLQSIERGEFLIGKQKGKPIFFGEAKSPEPGVMMLDRVYIPRPLQRPRLVSGILGQAGNLLLEKGKEVIMFIDSDKEVWTEAAQSVGFKSEVRFRLILLR